MAAITAGVIAAGSTVYAANRAKKAGAEQSRAINQATQASNDVNLQIYNQNRADFEPWRQAGLPALDRLTRFSAGDTSDFFNSPDYNFRRTEGQRDLGNAFRAGGSALSGNALRALSEFNQGLAGGEVGNWWNRQAGLAGIGQQATGAAADAGTNYSGMFGRNALAGADAGGARASGIVNQANVIGQGLNQLGQIAGYYRRPPKQPTGNPYGNTYAGYPGMG